MRIGALAYLLLVGIVAYAEEKSYRGYHVLSAKASNREQLALLQKLGSDEHLNWAAEPSLIRSAVFAVSPERKEEVMDTLKRAGMSVTVQSEDLQTQIDAEKRANTVNRLKHSRAKTNSLPSHDVYYTASQVNDFLKAFEENYSDLAKRKLLERRTHDGRPVYYMEIGTPGENKRVIFIETLAHAREWITTASMLYTIDYLLRGFGTSERVNKVLTDYTWIIIPMVNPDGYMHSMDEDRMWRNNRRRFDDGCIGVNLNRNYDVEFNTTGVSQICGDYDYPGPGPFSEPETQNVRDLFRQLKRRIAGFLSVHSYSQLLLYPWGYIDTDDTYEYPDNLNKLVEVGKIMHTALPNYSLGTAFGVLGYGASGAAEDWALKDKPGIYSYCYELRPKTWDDGGFMLPPDQIIPTGQEFVQSIILMAEAMAETEGW